ncbi:MAG: radical SAM protein [Candidatus Omnitrophica bacterium]|nr:radical SAM protein [Candidatus Omnitrophota bacterium]
MIPFINVKRFLYKFLRQPSYAFRVLRKRAAAYLHYRTGSGRSSYPESVTLFLTHRCNLRCFMCGQKHRAGRELSLDNLKAIVDDLSSFRPNITLFGGEPMLHEGCMDLIKYIKGKGMHCIMITNALLVEDHAKDIVESGLDELNVSLDGNAGIHDAIRALPGAFNKIMAGLKKIRSLKSAANSAKPLVNLQCTVSKYNYKNLESLLDVALEASADSLTFHNLIFLDRGTLERQKECDAILGCASDDWEGFVFEPEIEPEILHEKIEKILSGRHAFTVDFYPNFPRPALIGYYGNPKAGSAGTSSKACLSPWIAAYIFPDGEVKPCLNLSYSFGNALKERFTGLWNNDKAVKFRSFLKKKRAFPACIRCTELFRY